MESCIDIREFRETSWRDTDRGCDSGVGLRVSNDLCTYGIWISGDNEDGILCGGHWYNHIYIVLSSLLPVVTVVRHVVGLFLERN